ncbi:hypothetical protein ACFQ14_07945 [Pseudahrensia aquimaris]|uniref:Lipoprotein n=1 Tax=Pseudahrensia aquimaris TaxID=744461 RepID=A0ABW3FF14_9HYPH
MLFLTQASKCYRRLGRTLAVKGFEVMILLRLFCMVSALVLSGCATAVVTGAVVGTAATATKVAVKTTVGAGKIAYRGTKAVVKGGAALMADDEADRADEAVTAQ